MKTFRNSSIYISFCAIIFLIACNSNSTNATEKEKCDFLSPEKVTKWNIEFQKPAYDVYRNFNNIPFPKELLKDSPFPDNKHIIFNFGQLDNSIQNYYLFAIIGIGSIDSISTLDYSSLIYYDKIKEKWETASKNLFEQATYSWEEYVNDDKKRLPTLGYTVPNVDINICPHKHFDIIRFGVDTSLRNKETWLKLYFHEEDLENNEVVNFDACLPCPPTCQQ